MKAVVDTNVFVRAIINPQGSVGPVLERLREREYTSLISRAALDELVQVLHRPRLRQKYGLTDRNLDAVVRLIVLRSELIDPQQRIAVCRDPEDDKFLEIAVAGQADAIVTGDADLLVLHPFEGIPILTPAHFLARLEQG